MKREDALEYHASPRPGKIAVVPTKRLTNQRDLSLAYSPGVAVPVLAHRLLLTPEGQAGRRSTAELVHGLLARLPVPAPVR